MIQKLMALELIKEDVSDEEMINADGESEIDIDSCVFVQYRWCRGEQDYIEVPLEQS